MHQVDVVLYEVFEASYHLLIKGAQLNLLHASLLLCFGQLNRLVLQQLIVAQ